MNPQSGPSHRHIQPSKLGNLIGLELCPRYYKLRVQEEGHEHLNHDKEEYREAFKSGNVVEKYQGDVLEREVRDDVEPLAAEFYDLEVISLSDIAVEIPEKVHNILSIPFDVDTISTGDFKYNGEPADDIKLSSNSDLSTGHFEDDATEMELRIAYTEHVLARILSTISSQSPDTDTPVVLYQPSLSCKINNWWITGDADLIFIWPPDQRTGNPEIRVIDVKLSEEQQTNHQIQTVAYTLAIQQIDDISTIDYELSAGVWTSFEDISSITRETLPSFDRASRESTLRRLTSDGGVLEQLHEQPFTEAEYQLNSKCTTCEFNEACYTDAVESAGIELLGINRGTQRALRRHGIDNLHELAKLAKPVNKDASETHPMDERPKPTSQYEHTYNKLAETPGIGEDLPSLIQRAQSLLGELSEHSKYAHKGKDAPFLTNQTYGELPYDHFIGTNEDDYVDGSMVRVYMNVQYDHVRDTIMGIAARVNATASSTDPITVVKTQPTIRHDPKQVQAEEYRLLDGFIKDVFNAIEIVGNGIDLSDSEMQNNPFLHFYTYSEQEKRVLEEHLMLHDQKDINSTSQHSTSQIERFRELLGMRAGTDQPMFTAVKPDIEQRMAIKTPTAGLVNVHRQFYPKYDKDDVFVPSTDWEYTPNDTSRLPDGETTVNLQDVFKRKFLDNEVPYVYDGDNIELMFNGYSTTPEGWYASRVRSGAQIPIAYLWAATDEIDDDWKEKARKVANKAPIDAFRFHDKDVQNVEINREDVEALMTRIAHLVAHVERGIHRKDGFNPEIKGHKQPIDTSNLLGAGVDDPSLVDACHDVIDIEFETQRSERYDYYMNHLQQKLRTGESMIVVVQSVEQSEGRIVVNAKLKYDKLPFDNPDRILSAIRKKGERRSTTGSFMVATPISDEGDIENNRPWEIEKNVLVTISNIDLESDTRDSFGDITFEVANIPTTGDYRPRHLIGTVEPRDDRDDYHMIREGQAYLLDPSTDDFTAERCASAFSVSQANHVADMLEDLITGNQPDNTSVKFNESTINDFTDWLDSVNHSDIDSPNTEQRKFIEDVSRELSLLQGPPGTGKTAGAMAPAIIGRLLSYGTEQNKPCRTIVSGASNKSIDEVLEDVSALVSAYRDDPSTGDELDNTMLLRVANTPDDPEHRYDNVHYVNYLEEQDFTDELVNRLTQKHTSTPYKHIVMFVTPSKSWRMNKDVFRHIEQDPHDLQTVLDDPSSFDPDSDEVPTLKLFDVLAADEASMMDVPKFILTGAFYERGGNVLISGDHRQLPPVQEHDWNDEFRPSIRALAPHLSILNFARFIINPDDVTVLPEDLRNLVIFNTENRPTPNVELHQLKTTYRCHEDLAEFLSDWVYEKLDGIQYESDQTDTMIPPQTSSPGIATALDPDNVVTVITYDSKQYQQSNALEAVLSRELINAIDPDVETGIVTPHNAQRALLERELIGISQDNTIVDTVERFQGGEKDMMILSSTVSDPDYIASESEFLLNLNRLNVSMSRMKKKLVVIASNAIFDHIPLDTEEYNQTILWKALADESGLTDETVTPDWEGTLNDFVSTSTPSMHHNVDSDEVIRVYHITT